MGAYEAIGVDALRLVLSALGDEAHVVVSGGAVVVVVVSVGTVSVVVVCVVCTVRGLHSETDSSCSASLASRRLWRSRSSTELGSASIPLVVRP